MKDLFKHSDKTFVVGDNRSYIAEVPHHLAQKELPRDVECIALFKLESRKANLLTFKHGSGYRTPITGKVLTNTKTGKEICFLNYHETRIMLEAAHYMHGGRRVTHEEMNTLRADDGRTLHQFLKDEAENL